MAKIIAFTIDTPGHLFPFVPLLQELRARGHEAIFTLAANGPLPEQIGSVPVTAREANYRCGTVASYGEPFAALLESYIRGNNPDLIIVDPALWGAMVAAEASGRKWISLAHNPKLFRPSGVDVRGPGFRPARSLWGRILRRIRYELLCIQNEADLEAFNLLRNSRGLGPLARADDIYRTPPLTIVCSAEPFEYPRKDWLQTTIFVGPLNWEPETTPPDWITSLGRRPVILVVGSSIGDAFGGNWVRTVIEALSNQPFQVIATLPTDVVPEPVPDNVLVARFVSHGHILPLASCVVCHGGPGVTQKALAAGVPVVAIPFAYDRFEIARRLEVSGAGVLLPIGKLTTLGVQKAVAEAIRCKSRAMAIARAFASAGGADLAASAVEEILWPHLAISAPRSGNAQE